MRLIDADALIADIRKNSASYFADDFAHEWVDRQPTIGQEPKTDGDCISRQAVLDLIEHYNSDGLGSVFYGYDEGVKFANAVNKLPLVNPQEPKTVLYSGDGYADGYMVYDMAECPNCGYEYEEGDKDWKEPFCPHCGQALEWESEG